MNTKERNNLTMKLGLTEKDADLYLEMVDFIPVEENGTVDGRTLHTALQVKKDFSDWIKQQLVNVDAIEGEDYETCTPLKGSETHGGQNKINYILTLETAQEICMSVGTAPRTNKETKAISKKARKTKTISENNWRNTQWHVKIRKAEHTKN